MPDTTRNGIDARVPAVVIHRGGYADVAVGRTLSRLGVPMYLIAQEGLAAPIWSSRHWLEKRRWDFARSESDSVAFLKEVGENIHARHGARPLLLTIADWLAIFIERNSLQLQERFVFPQPETPVLRSLLNKWEMHRLAEQHGIPTPAAACPATLGEVDSFLEAVGLPVVMKPADQYAGVGPSTKVIHDREDLVEEVVRAQSAGRPLNMFLQEYIPGGVASVWMCNGYFGARSDRNVTFTGKKLRQVSATGVASLAVCVPNESVAAQTRRFMEGIGYRGCVGIGWRYDERDGLYKVLDVNARISGVFRLFAGTNGMDVVRICYLDLTGQEIPPTALQPGRKWMLESDFASALSEVREGRMTMSEWIRSLRGVHETNWLAADDPLPALRWLWNGVTRAGRRTAQRGQ